MPPRDVNTILVGDDTLTIECGRTLRARGWNIVAVVTSEPRVVAWAAEHTLRVEGPGADLAERLPDADFLLSIANLRVLPAAVLARAARGAVNFHDGPLPERAGLNAPAWAIIEGASAYGITWHVMRDAVDRGPRVLDVTFDIAPNETALSLNARCLEAALASFDDVLRELETHAIARAAPIEGTFRATRRLDRPPLGGVLDLTRPAAELDALVRGLDFGPYDNPLGTAKILLHDRALIVAESAVVDGIAAPGGGRTPDVLPTAGDGLRVARLTTLEGEPVAPTTVDLAGIDTSFDAEALETWGRTAARFETRWTETLARFSPSPAPLVSSGRRGDDHARTRVRRACGGTDAERIAAALTVLWRLGDEDAVGLTVLDASASGHARDARLYDARLPLMVDVDGAAARADVTDAVRTGLDELRERGPWAKDLVARSPRLRGRDAARAPIVVVTHAPGATATPRGDDLTLFLSPDAIEAEFDGERFESADVERLLGCLDAVVRADAATPIAEIDLVTDDECRLLLEAWNDTAAAPPPHATIHDAIIASLNERPDADAVVAADGRLTGKALLERSAAVARALAHAGVQAGDRVGIATSRTTDLVVAVLGVLRAGAAYVPLDPTYPEERLRFMRKDAGLRMTIADDVEALVQSSGGSTAGNPGGGASGDDAAYVIYTSGSTGTPKGVVIEHRNVLNFFAGMDARIDAKPGDALLAVTSLSFDISVLELLWTLTRGMKVVLNDDAAATSARAESSTGLSLYFWGNDDGPGEAKYALLLDAARFADANGFEAIWTPERHFHAFGGPYPNPSVTSAALAAITERLAIRAGSCVVPLHHPMRVAEEWAVVDNLSNGRVGISFASGWQADDFVLRPDAYDDRKDGMFRAIDTVQRLWRGEAVAFPGPDGRPIDRSSLPRPVQRELPTWVTAAGSPDTFRRAGAVGANMLTHLLGQSIEEVERKIRIYREARAEAGHDPRTGRVTLMLHTYLGADRDEVREIVREPMKQYLASATALLAKDAWAFPAFKRPDETAAPPAIDLTALSAEEMDALVDHAFERYFTTSGLFGTVDDALAMIERTTAAGVNEVACLVDYGVAPDLVRRMLPELGRVRAALAATTREVDETPGAAAHDFAQLIAREHVTHLQCTPSQARLVLADDDDRAALGSLAQLMIGGEPFPESLRADLAGITPATVTNMYGPTETTIWSTTARIDPAASGPVGIGTPIVNTTVHVLDRAHRLVPPGLPGTLWIGGSGVARGYHERPALTADRFRPRSALGRLDGPGGDRLYDTGDDARWCPDGTLQCLGRHDGQVKLRGYRIELGEIQRVLEAHDAIVEAAADVRPVGGEPALVAWLRTAAGARPDDAALRAHLRTSLPAFMIPSLFVPLAEFPRTPNGKLDRRALMVASGAPASTATPTHGSFPTAETGARADLERDIAALWTELLGRSHDGTGIAVGLDDNFFDLGGHSLLIVRLQQQLAERLGARPALTDLYRFPTVRSFARHLRPDSDSNDAPDASSATDRARARAALRRRRTAPRVGQTDPGAPS